MSLHTLAVMILLSLITLPSMSRADFKDTLASALGTNPEFLVINLPPRPDTWPGAIFTYDMRIPIIRGRGDDPALTRGEPISIETNNVVDLSSGAKAGWGPLFAIAAKAIRRKTTSYLPLRPRKLHFHLLANDRTEIAWHINTVPSYVFATYTIAQDNKDFERAMKTMTGVSVNDIKSHGIAGGPASEFRSLCKIFGRAC